MAVVQLVVVVVFCLLVQKATGIIVTPLAEDWRWSTNKNNWTWSALSTLVQDGGQTIIVDHATTSIDDSARTKVVADLARNGLRADEVQIVVVTHGYPIHFGRNGVYKRARQYFSTFEYNGREFDRTTLYERGELRITPHVTLWYTPGHAPEDISAIVRNVPGRGTVAIVGELIHDGEDALDSRHWESRASSAHIGRKNRNRVICAADYILPGYGPMFRVTEQMRTVARCTDGTENFASTPASTAVESTETGVTTVRPTVARDQSERGPQPSLPYPERYWWEYESEYQRRLHHHLLLEHHRRQEEHRRREEEYRSHEEYRRRLEHHRRLQEHHRQVDERRRQEHQQQLDYHRRLQEHQRTVEDQRRRDEYNRQVEQHRREQERQRQIDEQRRRHHQQQVEYQRRLEDHRQQQYHHQLREHYRQQEYHRQLQEHHRQAHHRQLLDHHKRHEEERRRLEHHRQLAEYYRRYHDYPRDEYHRRLLEDYYWRYHHYPRNEDERRRYEHYRQLLEDYYRRYNHNPSDEEERRRLEHYRRLLDDHYRRYYNHYTAPPVAPTEPSSRDDDEQQRRYQQQLDQYHRERQAWEQANERHRQELERQYREAELRRQQDRWWLDYPQKDAASAQNREDPKEESKKTIEDELDSEASGKDTKKHADQYDEKEEKKDDSDSKRKEDEEEAVEAEEQKMDDKDEKEEDLPEYSRYRAHNGAQNDKKEGEHSRRRTRDIPEQSDEYNSDEKSSELSVE